MTIPAFHRGNWHRISGLVLAPQTDHSAAAPKPKRQQSIPPNHRARVARAKKFVPPVVETGDDEDSGDGGDGDGPPRKPLRLLSKAQVLDKVPLSFASVWRLMNEGTFPQARVIANNKTCWYEHEIDAWIKSAPLRPLLGKGE